jgi:hypothetical protein
MKRKISFTTLAVAGAMSVGVATASGPVAGASTRLRPAAAAPRSTNPGATIERSTTRIVSDDVFRVTRRVEQRAGSRRVVFSATDLRTGRAVRLN